MEKQGVIREGLTPPEHEPQKAAQLGEKNAAPTEHAKELDNDFRKRAAEVARINIK